LHAICNGITIDCEDESRGPLEHGIRAAEQQLSRGANSHDASSATTVVDNNIFVGEVALPATTAIATTTTVDIDYPLNLPLPPGFRLYAGLGTAVAAGWNVTPIMGKY
jgi:hypothetical protein